MVFVNQNTVTDLMQIRIPPRIGQRKIIADFNNSKTTTHTSGEQDSHHKDTHTHTETETHAHTQRQTDTHTQRQTDRHTHTHLSFSHRHKHANAPYTLALFLGFKRHQQALVTNLKAIHIHNGLNYVSIHKWYYHEPADRSC